MIRLEPVHIGARRALGGSGGDRRLERLAEVEQLGHLALVLRQVADDRPVNSERYGPRTSVPRPWRR